MEFNAQREFEKIKKRAEKIEKGETKQTLPPLKGKTFGIVRVVNEEEKVIAFGMSEEEARSLLGHVKYRLTALEVPNDKGEPYYETPTYRVQEDA